METLPEEGSPTFDAEIEARLIIVNEAVSGLPITLAIGILMAVVDDIISESEDDQEAQWRGLARGIQAKINGDFDATTH